MPITVKCADLYQHSWQGQWWSAPSDQLYHSPCQQWISWPHTHNRVSALEHWKLRKKKGFWLEFSKTFTWADGADSCLAPLTGFNTGEFSWSIYVERPDRPPPPPVHHNLGWTGRPWLEWLWSLYLCGKIHPSTGMWSDSQTRWTRGETPLKILGSDQIGNKDNRFFSTEFQWIGKTKQTLERKKHYLWIFKSPEHTKIYNNWIWAFSFHFMSVGVALTFHPL